MTPKQMRPTTSVALFLLGMCALLNLYAPQPILTEIGRWAATSPEHAAWTISATTLGVALLAPLAGAFSDRHGRKRVMLAALVALIVATLACMAAPTFPALLVFRLLQGVATPFVFAVAVAYIGEELPHRESVRANGLYVAGTAFGGFSGRFFSGLAVDVTHDWRMAFAPILILLAAALAATAAWLPRERAFTPAASTLDGIRGMGLHLRDWRHLATCLVGASLLFQQVATFTFGSLHLQAPPIGLTAVQVGFVFVVFLFPTVLTPVVSRIIGRRGRVAAFAGSTVVGLAGLALANLASAAAVIAGLTLSCIAVFAGQACATGFTAEHATRARSAAVGLYLTAYYLGGTLGGVVPAPVYAGAGWSATLAVVAAVTAVSASVGMLAWRPVRS